MAFHNNSWVIMAHSSEEFCKFMKANGIKHTLVAPYHPRSNGQAERFVQTFKQFFKAEDSDSIIQSLARFLFSNRKTPNSTTGQTPAELFQNHRLRTRLDLMRPELGRKVFDRQTDQKARYGKISKGREFTLWWRSSGAKFRWWAEVAWWHCYGAARSRLL